jgi:hypothetical protein
MDESDFAGNEVRQCSNSLNSELSELLVQYAVGVSLYSVHCTQIKIGHVIYSKTVSRRMIVSILYHTSNRYQIESIRDSYTVYGIRHTV